MFWIGLLVGVAIGAVAMFVVFAFRLADPDRETAKQRETREIAEAQAREWARRDPA